MEYTEIENIRQAAIRLNLDGAQWLKYMPIDVLAKSYNGTGPEFLPARIRQKLDRAARHVLPAVMIHDVDYTMSDGTRQSFIRANRRFFWNCVTCAMAAYPWHNWRRFALMLESWLMYRAVSQDNFGWVAWIQAYEKLKK